MFTLRGGLCTLRTRPPGLPGPYSPCAGGSGVFTHAQPCPTRGPLFPRTRTHTHTPPECRGVSAPGGTHTCTQDTRALPRGCLPLPARPLGHTSWTKATSLQGMACVNTTTRSLSAGGCSPTLLSGKVIKLGAMGLCM